MVVVVLLGAFDHGKMQILVVNPKFHGCEFVHLKDFSWKQFQFGRPVFEIGIQPPAKYRCETVIPWVGTF